MEKRTSTQTYEKANQDRGDWSQRSVDKQSAKIVNTKPKNK